MKQNKDNTPFGPVNSEAIISALGDAVTVQDRNFRIIYQNPAMKELFGENLGSPCHSVYEKRAAVCPDCPVEACFKDGGIHTSERTVTIQGELRTVENTASPLMNEIGEIYAAVEVVHDVTQRKKTEYLLTRFMNMYAALSQTNKAIMESGSREEMLDRVCHAAVEFGKFSLAVIGLTDPEGVVRSVAHYGVASRFLDTLIIHADARKEEGRGPTGRAIQEEAPYICNDYHNDPITTPWRITAQEYGIQASAAFPLKQRGSVIGALKIYSDYAGYFDDEIVNLMTEMAANISFGLENFLREDQSRLSVEALRNSEERLKLVLEGSNDGYCDWHIPTSSVWMSSRYVEMLGYSQGELKPKPETIKELVHPEDWERVEKFLDEELSSRHPYFEIDIRMMVKNGDWKWFLYRGKVVERDRNGMTTRVAGTCTDITEKKMYEEQLRYANIHDQLTGLYNRAYFDAEFARIKSGRSYPVSVVIADVDGLKLVNDSFGHAAGDRLIQLAARTLKDAFRADDVVARIGGDEFAVILPNADEEMVKEAVRRVRNSLATARDSEEDYSLSISLGSATAVSPELLNEALKQADSRMYYYKFRRKSGQHA